MRTSLVGLVVFALVAAACGGSADSTEAGPGTSSSSVAPPAAETSVPPQPGEVLKLRYGTLTERTVDIGADGRNTTAAVAAMNEFTVDMYKQLAADSEPNLVLSPYSATFALSMILAGANGATAEEMQAVLHASDDPSADWHEGINAYDLSLDSRTAGSPTVWGAANKVWTTPGLPLVEDYLDVLTGTYGSPLAEADFAADPEKERVVINDWIADQTSGLIPELWPPDSLTPATEMVLVNAVALDAPWEFPFDPESTRRKQFNLIDGTMVKVDMMRYDEFLPSGRGDGFQAVELPYGGGALSMVVILPDDFEAFEQSLSTEILDKVFWSIKEQGIHLTMPKWSTRTHLTLNETLAAMGMPTAFESGSADFSGMTGSPGLYLSRVEHEAFIEVDEQGTRAAAATGGAMEGSHGPTVEVNRPFLYVIRDKGAGNTLFIGRVLDPSIPAG